MPRKGALSCVLGQEDPQPSGGLGGLPLQVRVFRLDDRLVLYSAP
jgi:hypothetical protein